MKTEKEIREQLEEFKIQLRDYEGDDETIFELYRGWIDALEYVLADDENIFETMK